MRVLMTADAVGGVWTYAVDLARALAPLGVEVTLATMGRRPSASQRAEAGRLTVFESDYALEWMPEPWSDVDAAGEWLLDLASDLAPDVVHVNGFAHAALPFGVPRIAAIHSCALTWMRAVGRGAPGPEWAEYRRRTARALATAEEVVAPTAAILLDVLEMYGRLRTGCVIANGRDGARWRPGDKQPFVLCAGRLWDEAKGLGDVLACARSLAWPVRIAGATALDGRGVDVPPEVELLGELSADELARHLARASIYVLPARYEPFGLSVLEAALSGCALVLGDLPSLREVWGDTAIYVAPGDHAALGKAIAELICAPGHRAAYAQRSRSRALELTPQRTAAAYLAVYQRLVAASAREECA